jgi:hypothetical protein
VAESFSTLAEICTCAKITPTKTMEGIRMSKAFYFFFVCYFFSTNSYADVAPEARTWGADIYMTNFSNEQEEKVKAAVEIIKKVIMTKEFKDRVYNYTYKGVKQFVDNKGLSNEEVYRKLIEGAEIVGNTTKNNTMDVELELYQDTSKTIGYTYPHTVRIWMNKKYFNRYTPIKVADNLMHEWMHKLGFTHSTVWSKDRDHSVPYAIGYLIEELASKLPK